MTERGIRLRTNHAGGIEGGITNGMPILLRCAFKPTPSIGKQQNTVNLETMSDDTIEVGGRHDSCIVPRAVPVVESAVAFALLDIMEEG
jgi:chorismate synthase